MRRVLNKCDKVRVEWTARKLEANYRSGLAVYDNAVQRGVVWDNARKSELILSLILEKPIPPLYATKGDDGKYSFIDGKQRGMAIIQFMNDEFCLEGLDCVEVLDEETGEVEEVDINTLVFSELEPDLQDAIKDSALTIIVINNPTDDEICNYFYLLNNGKPLSAVTLTRTQAKSRKELYTLGQHELFKSALTKKAFENYTNEDIVIKSYAMLHEKDPSMETKVIRPYMAQAEITKEDMDQLNQIFDRLLKAHKIIEDKKIAKRIITRTHMISLVPWVWKSIEENVSVEDFAHWCVTFFCGKRSASISSKYNGAAGAGSAKKDSVKRRQEALSESWKEWIAWNNSFSKPKEAEAS